VSARPVEQVTALAMGSTEVTGPTENTRSRPVARPCAEIFPRCRYKGELEGVVVPRDVVVLQENVFQHPLQVTTSPVRRIHL